MAIKPKRQKLTKRGRTKFRIRRKMSGTAARPRLSVFRSDRYTYAQLIDDLEGKTIVAASTQDKEVISAISRLAVEKDAEAAQERPKSSKSVTAAKALGLVLAELAKTRSVTEVVFDRNGFVYHGRIQAVAEGARQGGLKL